MSYEDIELMFRTEDVQKFSKKRLQEIYIDLIGIEPNRYWSKSELVYQIRSIISDTKRTMDLAKNIKF